MSKQNEVEIKVRVRRNPRKAIRKIVLLLITLYVAFLIFGAVRNLVVTHLAKVEQVQHAVLQNTVSAQGVLVRDEKTVAAPRSGTLKVIAAEGERVRLGAVIAQVVVASMESKTGETVFNIIAPRAGVVSYYIDGLEEVYSPKNIKELDLTKLETIKSEPHQFTPGSQVEAGKPVCKIVNNLEPVSIIAVTKEDLKLPEKKQKSAVQLVFGSQGQDLVQATVQDKSFGGKANQLLISSMNYDQQLMISRKIEFSIVTDRFEGYVVPAAAIVQKDGKDGIFTVFKERVKWKNVEVVGRVREKVVISGVTPDIKVILNPEYVKEGRPLRLP